MHVGGYQINVLDYTLQPGDFLPMVLRYADQLIPAQHHFAGKIHECIQKRHIHTDGLIRTLHLHS
ncbi:MAG: hypothetical protein BWY82_00845 [Verrucomicrobia bacterium ADurb.Bin474]|nr:MAG: hypothetical protein BWY82_00845 [Verrucomicrobia bacterium ADurb.Bin474]